MTKIQKWDELSHPTSEFQCFSATLLFSSVILMMSKRAEISWKHFEYNFLPSHFQKCIRS